MNSSDANLQMKMASHKLGTVMASNQPPIRDTQRRIETQIHRRKKAKAFSALEAEWDDIGPMPPVHLRMPSGLMVPTPLNTRKVPQNMPLQPSKKTK